MTNQDPKLPDPGLGNPPQYRDPDSFGSGSLFIALWILGAFVIVGAVAYAVS